MEPFVFPYPQEYKLWEADLKLMSEAIRNVAKQNDLTYIPLWDRLLYAAKETSYDKITTDGVHLTKLGHAVLAQTWMEACKEAV